MTNDIVDSLIQKINDNKAPIVPWFLQFLEFALDLPRTVNPPFQMMAIRNDGYVYAAVNNESFFRPTSVPRFIGQQYIGHFSRARKEDLIQGIVDFCYFIKAEPKERSYLLEFVKAIEDFGTQI
jgi:hypothetical protein